MLGKWISTRRMRATRLAAGSAALLAFVSGCASVPDPNVQAAGTLRPQADRTYSAFPQGSWPADNWWKAYGDEQLDRLMAEGLTGSPDIAAAAARLRLARGMVQESGAALLPQVDATASATLDKRSYNNGFPKEFVPKGWLDGGQVAAAASFDPDLWGRNRAALAAATSEADAAAIEAQEARIVLATAIASAYFDLARLHAERDVREEALKVRRASLKLVTDKEAAGLEIRGNVRQVQALESQARSLLGGTLQAIAERENQIAALTGQGPDRGRAIARPALADAMPASLPADATTALVARRPDIAAARARAEAAADRINVARADFFPAIRLNALLGLQALGIGNLVASDSLYGSVGPAVSLPIFHGGSLTGRYRQAEARYDETIARYDGAVVTAYREVADAVSAQVSFARRLEGARAARAAMEDAYRIARLRYDGGLSNFADVLLVEDRLLEARLAEATLEAQTRTSNVALIRALGGGFTSGAVETNGG